MPDVSGINMMEPVGNGCPLKITLPLTLPKGGPCFPQPHSSNRQAIIAVDRHRDLSMKAFSLLYVE